MKLDMDHELIRVYLTRYLVECVTILGYKGEGGGSKNAGGFALQLLELVEFLNINTDPIHQKKKKINNNNRIK